MQQQHLQSLLFGDKNQFFIVLAKQVFHVFSSNFVFENGFILLRMSFFQICLIEN